MYVTFFQGSAKVMETPPVEITEGWDPKSHMLPLQLAFPLGKLPPGEYDCEVTVLDVSTQKAAFWQAPVMGGSRKLRWEGVRMTSGVYDRLVYGGQASWNRPQRFVHPSGSSRLTAEAHGEARLCAQAMTRSDGDAAPPAPEGCFLFLPGLRLRRFGGRLGGLAQTLNTRPDSVDGGLRVLERLSPGRSRLPSCSRWLQNAPRARRPPIPPVPAGSRRCRMELWCGRQLPPGKHMPRFRSRR